MPKICLASLQTPGMPPIKYLQLPILGKTLGLKKTTTPYFVMFDSCESPVIGLGQRVGTNGLT